MRQLTLAVSLILSGSPAIAGEAPTHVGAAEFRADIAYVRAMIARMHPDPGFSTDPLAMHLALDRMAQDLPATLTRDDAWRRLASLNGLLADGHFFIGFPDWRGETRRWLAGGGTLFPVEVSVGADGALYLDAGTGPAQQERIVSVNDVPAGLLVSQLASLAHGDTALFRANLLGRRWSFYYWKVFGAPERYRLVLEKHGARRTVDVPGRVTLPRVLEDEARRAYDFSIGPDGVAVLTVDSFSLADPAPFQAFTRAAFARMRAQGVTRLVIDISNNGGGDDAIWLDGLMPYLASRPYRTGSTFHGLTRPQPNVQPKPMQGEIATWRQPQGDNPSRFDGETAVRIGPGTYSSAVLFANVMRDFQFATLVGAGGAARRTQSGGVRDVMLPHTGLTMTLPRFILDPPAGRSPGALLDAD